MTVIELAEAAQKLSIQERKELVKIIVDSIDIPVQKHSILELAGLGKEIWEGIDAQDYVNQLRNEWDERR